MRDLLVAAVEYTVYRGVIPKLPLSLLDMTLNNLMVRPQLWEIRHTLSFLSIPGPLWPEMIATEKVQSMGQIELFDI